MHEAAYKRRITMLLFTCAWFFLPLDDVIICCDKHRHPSRFASQEHASTVPPRARCKSGNEHVEDLAGTAGQLLKGIVAC